ncbi:MAG: type II secretion system GspH family protein [Candidatus Sumerlaeia bacterium]|nr:type II secretion system GspH family protein [Candidatus Sumerlaeia bacterium]
MRRVGYPYCHFLGFTFVELLVVVAIIGVLTAVATVNFMLAVDRARQVQCAARLKVIGSALYAYHIDYNAFPLADGVAGNQPTPFCTEFGNGPAGNGFWNGISLLLVECGYIQDRSILYCPALEKRYSARRDNLRYAYNCSTTDAGGYTGSENNLETDSGDVWLVRCLYLHPSTNGADRRKPVSFPHGLDRTMENVLFSNYRVELRPGGETLR